MASFIGVKKEKRLKTVEPFSNYQEWSTQRLTVIKWWHEIPSIA
jgi:hypothetical protein